MSGTAQRFFKYFVYLFEQLLIFIRRRVRKRFQIGKASVERRRIFGTRAADVFRILFFKIEQKLRNFLFDFAEPLLLVGKQFERFIYKIRLFVYFFKIFFHFGRHFE